MPFDKTGSRLYFPEATVQAAGVNPAFDSSWQVTTGAVRRKLQHKPTDSGGQYNTRSTSETSATPVYGLHDQYISDPLPANKTISGSVMITAQGRSGLQWRTVIRVVSGDGTTVRGTLFAGLAPTAFGNAAPFHNRIITGTMTDVNALAGDRVVIERGSYFNNTTTTSQSGGIGTHDGFAYPDAPPNDANGDIVINFRSWVEFTQPDIWGPPKPTLAGESVEVAEKPVRTPTRLSGANAFIAEKPVRTPTRLAGMIVNALIPRAGQIVSAIYAAGFPRTEPKVKLPDGRWVPLRPARLAQGDRPIMSYSNSSLTRSVSLANLPNADEFLVLMTSSKDQVPKALSGLPAGIPGVTWEEVYRTLDDRHAVWFGTGATSTGTVSIPGFGTEALYQRITSIFIVRGAKKNLGYQKNGFSLTSSPVVLTPEVSGRDQISFVSAVAGSANPAPVILKPPDWVTLRPGNQEIQLGRANPVAPNDLTPELSIAHGTGVSGLLAVIGGKTPYAPPAEGLPIIGTTRYYLHTDATSPQWSPWSTKWISTPTASNYYVGASTLPSTAATGNMTATRPSVRPNSVSAVQVSLPPVRAGVIAGSFRFVWPVDYIGEAYLRVIIRLVSADGQTVRGELADVTSTRNADSVSGLVETCAVSGNLAPLVAQRGDRIVAEIGFLFVQGLGGSAGLMQVVAASNGDYPFQDGVVYDNTKRGWLELIAN